MFYGPFVMACGTAVSEVVSTFINSWSNRNLLGYSNSEQWKDLALGCLLAMFCGAVVYPLAYMGWPDAFAVAAEVLLRLLLYGVLAYILKFEVLTYVERYREHLDGVEGLQLNPIQKDVEPNYAYFPVVFTPKLFGATRSEVVEALAEKGIGARKYFYPLTNTFECFHNAFEVDETPVALHMSRNVLTLPLYADLALSDVDVICDTVLECGKNG